MSKRQFVEKNKPTVKEDLDTVNLRRLSGRRHNTSHYSQGEEKIPVCGLPTKRANGFQNRGSIEHMLEMNLNIGESPLRTTKRMAVVPRTDVLSVAESSPYACNRSIGKSTIEQQRVPDPPPARPIRNISDGITSAAGLYL